MQCDSSQSVATLLHDLSAFPSRIAVSRTPCAASFVWYSRFLLATCVEASIFRIPKCSGLFATRSPPQPPTSCSLIAGGLVEKESHRWIVDANLTVRPMYFWFTHCVFHETVGLRPNKPLGFSEVQCLFRATLLRRMCLITEDQKKSLNDLAKNH